MTGIYKITSPTGKIYIGQSIDIDDRFKSYSKLQNCKNQTRLFNSFKKHGIDSHTFEVIEICKIELLNERERFFQNKFNTIGRNGLNCKLQSVHGKSGKLSSETISKIKEKVSKQKRKPHSEETKKKISDSHKGKKLSESHIYNLKKPKTEEHKSNMKGPRPKARVPKKKIKCPHCEKKGAPHVMKRFHFDNCGKQQEIKKIKCPHCEKEGSKSNMMRWHFDNCKLKN